MRSPSDEAQASDALKGMAIRQDDPQGAVLPDGALNDIDAQDGADVQSGAGERNGTDVQDGADMQVDAGGQDDVVLSLEVAYNGAPFAGFARQPGQLTVQGSIEEALSLLFRRPVETVCAGRTDSGVHAKGQVVSFCVRSCEVANRSGYKMLRSLNALTHDSISILSIRQRERGFSARFSATMREYRYFICTDTAAPLLMKDFCWHIPKPLDLEAMREAAGYLIGEHDFKSFCMAASAEGRSTMRNVFSIEVEGQELWGEHLVVVTVRGNAFLHSMVRTIVGTLVAVGKGQRGASWVQEVLAARDRGAAGENAPARGLVFWRVDYSGVRVHDPRFAASQGEEAHRRLSGSSGFEQA